MLERLKDRVTVAVVSGRGREDLESLVQVEGIAYAGAHGFDIRGPGGAEMGRETGGDHVAKLADAAERLREDLADVDGVIVEDKTHAVAIHWRQVAERDVPRVDRAVQAAADRVSGLRRTGGKKIYELRPDLAWDKGRAVLWLLEALGLDGDDVMPLYIGDDETDRDAFRALKGRGLSIFAAEEPQDTEADYRLAHPDEVRRFLARIAEAEEEETP